MSFLKVIEKYEKFNFEDYFNRVTDEDIKRSIYKNKLNEEDFLNIISPKGEKYLEEIAQKAHEISNRYFGKTVLLYTPLYIANMCVNRCAYCSYNHDNNILRAKLTMEEIEKEAKAIAKEGFKHIILLTGESPKDTPIEYLVDAIKVLKDYFPSITLEVQPLSEEDYKKAIEAGADGLTVYQEVYDREIYKKVHLGGPKRNYNFRLDAPERGAKAGMRNISVSALLGLNDFRKEVFLTALHGKYIKDNYPGVDVAFSAPRIRPHAGTFHDIYPVSDKNLVQCILALRLFHNNSVINISTRESASFREKLIPLGVNKMSAGVLTEVGGHCKDTKGKGESQFLISDKSSTEDVKKMIKGLGYQPIFKDWERI